MRTFETRKEFYQDLLERISLPEGVEATIDFKSQLSYGDNGLICFDYSSFGAFYRPEVSFGLYGDELGHWIHARDFDFVWSGDEFWQRSLERKDTPQVIKDIHIALDEVIGHYPCQIGDSKFYGLREEPVIARMKRHCTEVFGWTYDKPSLMMLQQHRFSTRFEFEPRSFVSIPHSFLKESFQYAGEGSQKCRPKAGLRVPDSSQTVEELRSYADRARKIADQLEQFERIFNPA